MSAAIWIFASLAQVSTSTPSAPPLQTGTPVATEVSCPPSAQEVARLMALPLDKFDQSSSDGWRVYAARGCYLDAARLISGYLRTSADLPKASLLRFHQFQMTAFAGDVPEALKILDEVKRLDELRDADWGWRLYVSGTEAFMKRDQVSLRQRIEDLDAFAGQQGPTEWKARLNNNVLKGLMKCFDQPYKAAYGPRCVDSEAARTIASGHRNSTANP
jgi:hypothetical protein